MLIDAAPVTGSLIYSALSDCLIVFCTAGFSSKWTFCSADFVLLSGFVLYVRLVNDCRNMAADGAALAEVRAGITFGVKLYVLWDSPEEVVDISSEGVMPLRNFRMSSNSSVVVRVQRKVVCFRAGTFAVCESWFRIFVEWTKIFTMS